MRTWNTFVQTIIFSLIVISSVTSCSYIKTKDDDLSTFFCQPISAKQSLDRLFGLAKKWDSKAYLVGLDISIDTDCDDQPRKLGAYFQSPENSKQSIIIYIEKGDNLSLHHVQHPNGVHQVEPIIDSEWNLDSGAALEKFLEQYENYIDNMRPLYSAGLYLERKIYNSESIVVWRLTVGEGSSNDLGVYYFYLDALTGDVIDQSLLD